MSKERLSLGRRGEDLCEEFLKRKGYRIAERNYRCRMGEIDIVAMDGDTVCFVEVKTRRTPKFGLPQEAVTFRKREKLMRLALLYMKKKKLEGKSMRFDVVAVSGGIELIKDAFSAEGRYRY